MRLQTARAGLSVVALMSLNLAACNMVNDAVPANYQSLHETRPENGEKALDVNIRYDVGRMEIMRNHGPELFSLDLEYNSNRITPRFSFDDAGTTGNFRLSTEQHHEFGGGNEHNDLTLKLKDDIPLDLNLTAGVSDSHFDLTGLQVRSFQLRGGVGRTEVFFDQAVTQQLERLEIESGVGSLTVHGLGNTQVQRVNLRGGVGHTELDYTGTAFAGRTDTDISVGVGQVRLLLPKDAGIQIEGEGSFLSNISAPSFQKDGQTYTHPATDGTPIRLYIHVRSGVGGVNVELI
jgi:hypothetical protein